MFLLKNEFLIEKVIFKKNWKKQKSKKWLIYGKLMKTGWFLKIRKICSQGFLRFFNKLFCLFFQMEKKIFWVIFTEFRKINFELNVFKWNFLMKNLFFKKTLKHAKVFV